MMMRRASNGKSILEELFGRKVTKNHQGPEEDEDDEDDEHDDHDDNDCLDLSLGTSATEHSSSAYSRFLTDDSLNDITLQGNDGVRIPANRGILASKSRVFQRLLLGSFAMTDQGDFKSVQLNFRGEVIRAVVEFVLTDTAKILDIDTIRAHKQRQQQQNQRRTSSTSSTSSSARSIQSAPAARSRGLLDHVGHLQKPSRTSFHYISTSKSVANKGSHTILPSIYTLNQIHALVSLTRAAVSFNLPTLGHQALDTLSLYLQRSPSAIFAVLEAIRREEQESSSSQQPEQQQHQQEEQESSQRQQQQQPKQPGVPKEVQGLARTSLRNFVGPIESGTVEFLSLPVLEEIVSDDKLRLDDYQLFKLVKRWARHQDRDHDNEQVVKVSKTNISSPLTLADSQQPTDGTVSAKVQAEGGDTTSKTASSSVSNHQETITTETTSSSGDRNVMAQALIMKYIRLECIDPSLLAGTVAKSGLVTQEQLLQAFCKQAVAASKYHGVVFQRPRNVSASWKKSLSNVFTSWHDNEFKQDVLNYPPMKTGIHQWTMLVEESGDCTWLGLFMSNLCDTFHDENDKDNDDNEDAMQNRSWVYSNDGEAFHGGVAQPMSGNNNNNNSMRPGFSSGSRVTMTLNLKSKDPGNGTLHARVNDGEVFTIFENLRWHLNEYEGEGYLPSVSMNTPGRVRLLEIRHLRG